MQFHQHYKSKAAAGLLLITLLIIHSVKLLHSHSAWHIATQYTGSGVLYYSGAEPGLQFSAGCSVCNYHLTKDADGFTSVINSCPQYFPLAFCPPVFSTKSLFSFPSFETRGPPSVV